MTDEDEDRIFEARASGRSARDVEREFGVTVAQVEKVTAARVEALQSGAGLRQSVGGPFSISRRIWSSEIGL
jgi:hypothetical protein